MSRVQSSENMTSSAAAAAELAADTSIDEAKQDAVQDHTVRLCFRDNVSGMDLLNGVVLNQRLPKSDNLGTVVIRGLKSTAFSNPVGSDVVASAKLLDNADMPLHECSDNASGWLHLDEDAPDGFTPMMNMLPYESSRKAHDMYKPVGSLKNEELIKRYSGVSIDSLSDECVNMPGESYYYVDKVSRCNFCP